MQKRSRFNRRSLSAQITINFIALVLLTAIAIGLPAVWLIRDQLARRAWAQVDQGVRTSQALYTARQNEIANLATLTAQRPTLHELLTENDPHTLQHYLNTLQTGAGLDLIWVCNPQQQSVAQTRPLDNKDLCASDLHASFYLVTSGQAWLLAAQPLPIQPNDHLVIVGIALDDTFARQIREQTGLEHTLLVNNNPAASSLDIASWQSCCAKNWAENDARVNFNIDGVPYYAARLTLDHPSLKAEVALDVADVAASQHRLIWTMLVSILFVAILGSGLGALLAQRINRPLAHLTHAASALSKGDLSKPINVEVDVREIALVAQALENARADLESTLGQLRQEKAWGEHLLEAIVEGIVTLDHHGRVTFFSHGAERITGWSRQQVIGRTCDQIFTPLETNEPFSSLIPMPGRSKKIPVELPNERQAILAITGAQLFPPGGDDTRIALVFRDVSEEEAIHRLLGHFLANVAHEFRTPLASVAASAELLLDQAPDLSPAELNELLLSLHLGVLGLQTLIDNLLESASIRAEHFRVSPRPANLNKIIAQAVNTMQPLLDKHQQRLVIELPAAMPNVLADPRRSVQVLVNLISNASKYGPDDAEIIIRSSTSDEPGWMQVSVIDQGKGIPVEQRQDLFRRFKRLNTGDQQTKYGAGLGLSVVKAIVEAQGGAVGVQDRPGGGSIFWFTIPIKGT